MRAVAVIPAKGTSHRIPGKNARLFHGKPIIAFSIETAWESGLFDRVIVSTDSEEIAAIASRCYADSWQRHVDQLADDVGPHNITGRVVWEMGYTQHQFPEFACCIYATAPMLCVADLKRGFAAVKKGAPYAISVNSDPAQPLTDAGQFIYGTAEAFTSDMPLFAETTVIIPIDQRRVCDINIETDWLKAEQMYAALHRRAA